ncbi:zinc-dependent alcohol dehydrogenase [Pseudonocardia sp. TRM90224]|uniref:zinc-dependent alcohol dehydrogenase n=1 Tax=Pseudonocardia sp. TRM90224 TaxID=2812678 RepID=UPI001E335D46|nr:alcohol dehydrogenase catalytic domain-containing protein [Pseudonocardia sp. TRM90224]
MKQLTFEGRGATRWRDDVPAPTLGSAAAALVTPLVVSTCDMDAVAMSGRIRFRAGTPMGHEGVGVVAEVADGVTRVRPGDHVIMPWQISCGSCGRCRRGQDTFCTTVPPGSCYGWGPHVGRWGGFLADLVEVPFADHMLVPVPEDVDPIRVSGIGDNLVDAWRAVGPPLRECPGGTVLVGAAAASSSIGLYAALYARALGASDVLVAAPRPAGPTLWQAAELGLRTVAIEPDTLDVGAFDVTVDASGTADGLALALRSTGPGGTCTCTSGAVHRGAPVALPVYAMYMNVVTFRTGWVHTRSLLDEPLALVAGGAFDPTVIATITSFEDAPAALAEPFTKLIMRR